MTTGDQHAPGNYAIFDIVAALQWIKENIAAFGGDPEQVTVMGQGYGGALVNLLMVSPVTKGKRLSSTTMCKGVSCLLASLGVAAQKAKTSRFVIGNSKDLLP